MVTIWAAFIAGLGSTILFWVQPMAGRLLLGTFGGSASVWTTCLLFFQTVLLLGYLYAHGLARFFPRRASRLHLGGLLISLASMPLLFTGSGHPELHPIVQVLWTLTTHVGLPYIMLSATAPLLQAWIEGAGHGFPYRLYAWSNVGSMAGLFGYPLLIEPMLPLGQQQALWSIFYGIFVLAMGTYAWRNRESGMIPYVAHQSTSSRTVWLVASALGVVLLMSITEAIADDLTVSPLLWVVPLGCYLLSFIVVFGRPEWAQARGWALATFLIVPIMVWLLFKGWRLPWMIQVSGWCAGLTVGCMVCHGALIRTRPDQGRLTQFYLYIALGGALGGLGVSIIAPLVFPARFELHLAIIMLWLFGAWTVFAERKSAQPLRSNQGPRLLLIFTTSILIISLGSHIADTFSGDVRLLRSFYGVIKVKGYPPAGKRPSVQLLLDGRISHGYQYGPPRHLEPTAYFVEASGIGQTIATIKSPRKIAILGLGAGTLGSYARSGDEFTFYELNPDVIRVAREDFSFLEDAQGQILIVEGDGRSQLARSKETGHDLLVLDAFSGDAIPAHLLTREAMNLYWDRMTPDGIVAINVSNRHADLARVVMGHVEHQELHWRRIRFSAPSPMGPYLSDWMILSRHPGALKDLENTPGKAQASGVVWLDEHAPLLPLLTTL